jgi:flagellar biosynthetic protein FliQ
VTALVFVVLGAAMMGLLADFTREIMAQVANLSA